MMPWWTSWTFRSLTVVSYNKTAHGVFPQHTDAVPLSQLCVSTQPLVLSSLPVTQFPNRIVRQFKLADFHQFHVRTVTQFPNRIVRMIMRSKVFLETYNPIQRQVGRLDA